MKEFKWKAAEWISNYWMCEEGKKKIKNEGRKWGKEGRKKKETEEEKNKDKCRKMKKIERDMDGW